MDCLVETLNIVLGIIASSLSIFALIFSKKAADRNKKIEQYLKQNFNVTIDGTKNDVLTSKKAVSGKNGVSIIGDDNKINGGR